MDKFRYEVKTNYKSGWFAIDYIIAPNEKEMWENYDKHHTKSKIENKTITNKWKMPC